MFANSSFQLESSYLAQWALPNEGIPLYLTWENFADFDFIQIKKPADLIIREYYNVVKKREDENVIYFDELKSIGYLGIVFTHPMIEEESKDLFIALNFYKDNNLVFSQDFFSKLIRPRIEMIVPEEFTIVPEQKNTIDIKLTYKGYGSISGKIQFSKDDRNIIFNISKISDLSFMMVNYKTFKMLVEEYDVFRTHFDVSEIPEDQYLFRKYLENLFDLESFTQAEFFDTLNTIIENRKLKELLDKKIEEESIDFTNTFFEAVVDFIENRPVEDVYLIDSGEKEIEIKQNEKKLYVKTCFIDDFGNLYDLSKETIIYSKKDDFIILDQEWENKPGDWKWLKI